MLEWASDRALARLGRNQVFAVRGDVEEPTVLLIGTLTNRRGQVVASCFLHVAFPNPDNLRFALVTAQPDAETMIESVGLRKPRAILDRQIWKGWRDWCERRFTPGTSSWPRSSPLQRPTPSSG